MLDLQDKMNRKVNPDWIEANYEWYRAIWIECGELMDHYGWKWWKHQKPDMDQVTLELIDIWHFILSDKLKSGNATDWLVTTLETDLAHPESGDSLLETVEKMACDAIETRSGNVRVFAGLMQQAGLCFDDLFRSYVGKNVLNFFRQDHGYKDGTYHKIWDGKEDNEHLVDIVTGLDSDSADFSDNVYSMLEARYPA